MTTENKDNKNAVGRVGDMNTTDNRINIRQLYSNGYSDGSGKGTIVMSNGGEETGILATHWGCSCCDRETTEEDNILAEKLCRILNKAKVNLKGE